MTDPTDAKLEAAARWFIQQQPDAVDDPDSGIVANVAAKLAEHALMNEALEQGALAEQAKAVGACRAKIDAEREAAALEEFTDDVWQKIEDAPIDVMLEIVIPRNSAAISSPYRGFAIFERRSDAGALWHLGNERETLMGPFSHQGAVDAGWLWKHPEPLPENE